MKQSNDPTYKKVAVSDLIPYARNSRTHSESQIGKIAASIREFGFLNPVIVDAQNGIIAGHGRVMAAQKLGLTEVPVIEASHLTDSQRRAYIITDNRLALDAGWDYDLLKLEIEHFKEIDFNIDLLGFEDDFFNEMIGDGVMAEIGEISEINERCNFIIQCENIQQREHLKGILKVNKDKISFEEFQSVQ